MYWRMVVVVVYCISGAVFLWLYMTKPVIVSQNMIVNNPNCHVRFLNQREGIRLESSEWAPMIVDSDCSVGMPGDWAPCLRNTSLAQELIYPAFEIPLPILSDNVTPEHLQIILQAFQTYSRVFFLNTTNRILFFPQHGQNIIIDNAFYDGKNPPTNWTKGACTFNSGTHSPFLNKRQNQHFQKDSNPLSTVVFAASPDSFSFQHFLDRASHVLEQADEFVSKSDSNTILWISRKYPRKSEKTSVYTMLKSWGYPRTRIEKATRAYIRRLIYSCNVPFTHPFFSLRIIERMGVLRDIPLQNRKVVLFLSRQNLKRQLLNEVELKEGIMELLVQRGEGEVLVDLNEVDQSDYPAFIAWMGRKRAWIGWCSRWSVL